ncbi:hypothetical protein J6590_077002 [Homalodisca vitripennis]|nr:hypothetical protein J6590_077002 [Homalodisca vitripennis]
MQAGCFDTVYWVKRRRTGAEEVARRFHTTESSHCLLAVTFHTLPRKLRSHLEAPSPPRDDVITWVFRDYQLLLVSPQPHCSVALAITVSTRMPLGF